jgi:hypothetical protein
MWQAHGELFATMLAVRLILNKKVPMKATTQANILAPRALGI